MPGQLDAVIALQKTLDELAAAEERLHGIPDWMRELHEEHSAKKAEIDAVAAKAEEAHRQRAAAEAELADAQEKLKRYQSQISQVSTQREYGALLKEIDTVKQQMAELERLALESIETYEAANEEHAALEEAFGDLDARYQRELARWEEEKPAVEQTAVALKQEIERLRGTISRPHLLLFDRLFERNQGQTLAPIRAVENERRRGARFWCCGICNYRIRPQMVVEIRNRRSVLQCDCGKRILTVEETAAGGDD
ncbi:MAG: hypothetical protein D6696_18015 [Acidobacteria bacterium]|nr:MAG: hypothetical protein D6696_18015 [Acidobacteriota bacterium]